MYARIFFNFLMLVLLIQFLGCGSATPDPALQQAREQTIEIFDDLPAEGQDGFLLTFRSTAEESARSAFSGSQLKARLAFIKELDAELRRRNK